MPLTMTLAFGPLLKSLRKQAGMTQRDLAAALGYSESFIASLEKAHRQPDIQTVTERFIPALGLQDDPPRRANSIDAACNFAANLKMIDSWLVVWLASVAWRCWKVYPCGPPHCWARRNTVAATSPLFFPPVAQAEVEKLIADTHLQRGGALFVEMFATGQQMSLAMALATILAPTLGLLE